MNICVFGFGNIGALTSYFLRRADPIIISRRANGCDKKEVMISFLDNSAHGFEVRVCGLSESIDCEIAFFASKAYEVKYYVTNFKGVMKEAFCLQNGYGVWEEVAPFTLWKKAFPVPVTYGVMRTDNNFIVTGIGSYYLGGFKGSKPFYKDYVKEALINGGANVNDVENVEPYVWLKLLVNSAINPLTALLGVRNGALLTNQDLWRIVQKLVEEVIALTEKEGVKLPVDPLSFVRDVIDKTANNYSSMLQDVINGRKTEIEYINGYVVKKASQHGIDVPFNFILYYLLKSMESIRGLR